ncbi:U11/U12 small nuclear ribonucleoprotein 48 kDa protein isoform X1 [Ovis aries]|uniref:Small nuclear ribonucleoprotein U11/U12 subunit 48 n=1 Tax=Ovis aries TaxID=9940 RepID=A0AC11CLF7_SHEEP|nr:U11/U12 small nuclear ribonucleoprotein 48 kDa protein isoform X1 [Ovis aries]
MEAEPPPVEERRRLREELSEFVESCRRTLEEVTASLGWSLDRLEPGEEAAAAEDEAAICPYDSNHHMPKSSLAKHMVSCRLRKLGYTKEEEDKMYNSDFFYENANVPSVTLNKDSQFQIIKQARAAVGNDGDYYNQRVYSSLPVEVPLNHKRFVCDLTQADRLALYDFVVEETKKKRSDSQIIENDSDLFVDLAAKVNQDNSRKSPKSYLEILAEVRDYKRRRQSYRAKNVHITKKSYTEGVFPTQGVNPVSCTGRWILCHRTTGEPCHLHMTSVFYTHPLPLSSRPSRRWFGSRSWVSFICKDVRVLHPFSGLSCLSDLQHTDELHCLRQYTGLARVCPSPRSPRVDLVPRHASSVFLCLISKLFRLS